MACWGLSRLLRQPLLLLLLLFTEGCIDQQQNKQLLAFPSITAAAAAATPAADGKAGGEIPRGPAPKTMEQQEMNLPNLQKKTLFLIDNSPVVESHIVSNLLHQLLYTLAVPQAHVRPRDEALLLWGGRERSTAVSLGRWLAREAETIPANVQFVFLGTAYTRLNPRTLEALLEELHGRLGDMTEKAFVLGWGLADPEPTILHHFAATGSQVYPHLDAGTLWSRGAINAVKKAFQDTPPAVGVERDFVYELFVHLKNAQKLTLLHSELFCPTSPTVEEYERAQSEYPPPHIRPKELPASAAATSGASANNRTMTPAETAAAAAAETTAAIHKDCATFNSGTRHAPVLSHQMFDALIDFDEELMLQRDLLADKYTADEKMAEGGEYQKSIAELERTRPAFIVEPQDVMVAVKTHASNHETRLPLLRSLWASREALVQQAHQHSQGGHSGVASSPEEQHHLEESYKLLSLRFLSDVADPKQDIEALPSSSDIPAGKAGLCVRLQLILKDFLQNAEDGRRFLAVVDDDTLLNFRHLLDLLSLTLQPPIPARGFMANLLADKRGYRAHWPPYKRLAQEVRSHLAALASSARAAESTAATPLKDSRYTAAELTAASQLYGRGGPRPLEAVSPLYLGERYGYGLTGGSGSGGNEYVTMGGGVVLDRAAVQLVVQCIDSGRCSCPPDGTADDMLLGLWAQEVQVPLLHSRGFHQERPGDYHPLLVEAVTPVSFHRMQRTVKGTKKSYQDFVNIGDYSNSNHSNGSSTHSSSSSSSSSTLDDLIEVDWIDYDWHHAEDHRWLEREELHELGDEDPLMPRGIGDLFSRHAARGTRPMTPEELLAHEELEEFSSLHDEL